MKNLNKFGASAFVLFLSAAVLFCSNLALAASIERIEVRGAERIEPQTIISYLDLRVGDQLTQTNLDHALKSLFSTGLFADVTLAQRGNNLLVEVIENPVINQVVFEGNSKIEDPELLAEIQLRPRQVFTRTKVQSDVTRLYQVYRRNGRFSVKIEPKVIQLDQNRVDLVFEVEEGEVTKVSSIRFVGNKRFTDDQLRGEITTKQKAWYRFISSDDRYDPDRISFDQEMLRRFYLSEGYADFRILSAVAELSNNRDNFFITFTVEEGQRYKLGEVLIDSQLKYFDASQLDSEVDVKTGDWYDADLVQGIVDRLTDKLGDLQYAFVSVRPDIKRNREERTIDLTFQIKETPRVFVERIDVNGNVRTLDKVVRREMLLVEGDPFNRSKLARSEQGIRNLDFFETVDVQVKPGSAPDKSVVNIDVSEKSTGEVSVGAGFSTVDGPLADFSIRERNLLGTGQNLALGAVVAGVRSQIDLSFTEPRFLNRDLSTGFNLFRTTRNLQNESSFDQRRTGAGFQIGYPLSDRWRQTLRYRAERNEISDIQGDASRFITDQEGSRDTSAISQRISYNNLDSNLFPTDGWTYWLDTELTGLGGDSQYISGRTGMSFFYPFAKNVVFNVLGEAGAIQGYGDVDVVINERYFLGGNTFRGFERAGLGPRDQDTNDALGGNIFYRGTVETSFPFGMPEELGILGHLFTDFGTLTGIDQSGSEIADDSSIRATAGLGVSWRSPFGPVRVDFGIPFMKEDYDQQELVRFDFGTRF